MTVVVRLAGQASREKIFDDADDVAVDDVGCLAVTAGDGKTERTVAVYAPGAWVFSEVN